MKGMINPPSEIHSAVFLPDDRMVKTFFILLKNAGINKITHGCKSHSMVIRKKYQGVLFDQVLSPVINFFLRMEIKLCV